MNNQANIGVFLCKCGQEIEPHVDLDALQKIIDQSEEVAHCEIMSNPCLKPGIEGMTGAVVDKKLNRVIVAGCEGRLMLRKLEKEMEPLELRKGQVDMINLRGHVAAVSDLDPGEKAMKAAKLITASVAEMAVLNPSLQTRARIEGPVMIAGNGIASFAAAEELHRQGIDYLLETDSADPQEIVRRVHNAYPGERQYYGRLEKIVEKAVESPHATILPPGKLKGLSGVTGDYNLTYTDPDGGMDRRHKAGAIIACLDADFIPPGPEFGHEGQSVMIQSEMEEHIYRNGAPDGNVVFWISDYENDQAEFAPYSARSTWAMACHLRQSARRPRTIILYNEQMEVPLTAAERALNRKLGIIWIPYDKAVRPAVTDGFITFCNLSDHLEHDIDWKCLVLSPIRAVAGETLDTARILGLVHKEERFLTGHHARVRPEMVGREETYLAGSARYPCDLHEALTQGRRAANKTVEIFKQSESGELFVPRVVDPMVCTGGGTCAAACPYHALVLQNNSNDQREARVAALANQLADDEVMAFACGWGGLPAADVAGKMGLKYDPRVHILGVPCVGQIDPCVMARAFKEGAPGLILVGCLPEECHHSYGVDHTWSRVSVIKKIMTLCGFDRRRIALAHADLNKPEEFIRTVESFNKTIAALGPIAKTPENQSKLDAMYDLIKYNTRVRHLLSVSLRRPWEETYRGDQRHVLDYDRDFSAALTEEFLQHRILQVFRDTRKAYRVNELVGILHEDQGQVVASLWELINNGVVDMSHENREAVYALNS